MGKKKKKKKFTPVFYYSGSNIKKKTWKQICKMIGQGVVVYMTSGGPVNPPPYPPK